MLRDKRPLGRVAHPGAALPVGAHAVHRNGRLLIVVGEVQRHPCAHLGHTVHHVPRLRPPGVGIGAARGPPLINVQLQAHRLPLGGQHLPQDGHAADFVVVLLPPIPQAGLAQPVGEQQLPALQLRPLLADQELLSPEHRVPSQVTHLAAGHVVVEEVRPPVARRWAAQLIVPLADAAGVAVLREGTGERPVREPEPDADRRSTSPSPAHGGPFQPPCRP